MHVNLSLAPRNSDNITVRLQMMLQHSDVSASLVCTKKCEIYGVAQISRNWADLVKRARAKQLAPDEFQSGTFTISNLGNFGADIFDAILPPGVVSAGVQGTPSMLLCCAASRCADV